MFDPRGPEIDGDDFDEPDEFKGGKPSRGTPADGRLKENKPNRKKPKPAFPGAVAPFGADDGQTVSKRAKR